MYEEVESLLAKGKKVIDGTVMYDAEIVRKINNLGFNLHFSSEGVRWTKI